MVFSPCIVCTDSYYFSFATPPRWCSAFSWVASVSKAGRSLLACGSNSVVKRTGLRPAAYLGRWVPPRASIVAIFNLNRRYS
ncbi:DUF1010 domain-containing protein [Comamonas nitrativorans]|uniref:DUF1010 domain-containing protein n=1 Tax=Comamonas nitrativorans TaxID=108437 RepID=A0ABV9GZ22_9BURK